MGTEMGDNEVALARRGGMIEAAPGARAVTATTARREAPTTRVRLCFALCAFVV